MSDYDYYETQHDPYTDPGYGSYKSGMGRTPEPPKKKDHKFLKTLGKATAIALVFGLVSGSVFAGAHHVTTKLLGDDQETAQAEQGQSSDLYIQSERPAIREVTPTPSIGNSSDEASDTNSSNASTVATVPDVSAIANEVMPSIVQVTNMSIVEYRNWFGYGQYETESAGSGIIISEDDDYLYIATNNHVVANSQSLTITFCNDEAVSAEVQGTLPTGDLAVVKVKLSDIGSDTLSAIKVAKLGSSTDLTVGSGAIVIGNALGYGQSVTTGVISALDREVTLQDESGRTFTNHLIQTDAAINPGNSGGALLNMNGEVVGIVSAKYSSTDVEGMGYAIPITQASEILTGLVTNSDSVQSAAIDGEAYMGIAGVDVTEDMADKYDIPVGIYVAQIRSGGGAKDAGLTKGDVITAVDDKEISSMEELSEYITSHNPGDVIRVTYLSAETGYNATVSVDVTLGTKPQ